MEHFISIAATLGAQGLNGQVKIFPLSDHKERFEGLRGQESIWKRGDEMRLLKIQDVRAFGRFYVLTVEGFDSRVQAEELAGGELVIPESEVMPLPAGSYYIYQLIGLKVLDETLGFIGTLEEVLQPGSNDVYVVDGPRGQILVPALKSVVRKVDLATQSMLVSLPEGLVDDHED
jgi:16S rRNA processing protein RimM